MNKNLNQIINDCLFAKNPKDFRWDIRKNSNLLNIVFVGGTFGNFLRFIIDKFSVLTPDIKGNPFSTVGTSHKPLKYSGKIIRAHFSFVNDNKNICDLPVCLIMPNTELDYLYLKTSQWYRAGERRLVIDDLWQKKIKELDSAQQQNFIQNLRSHYSFDGPKVPKWIVRDAYRREFLDMKKSDHVKIFECYRNHSFFTKQKLFVLDLDSFFNFDYFVAGLEKLDSFFGLEIDFSRIDEIRSIFEKGFGLDQTRLDLKKLENVIDHIKRKKTFKIPKFNVSFEGYLYAYLEKKYNLTNLPQCESFFQSTGEISHRIEKK